MMLYKICRNYAYLLIFVIILKGLPWRYVTELCKLEQRIIHQLSWRLGHKYFVMNSRIIDVDSIVIKRDSLETNNSALFYPFVAALFMTIIIIISRIVDV